MVYLIYEKYLFDNLCVILQLAPWRDKDIDAGFPDVRWAQTAGYGYTPNAEFDRIFMAVSLDLPDYDSPSGE
jgi:hypothetical protein